MTYCLNPDCLKPRNPDSVTVCRSCGTRLILKDRYRAIAAIGQGGFGRTFLAIDEDKPSKPQCVIKQFLPIVAKHQRHLKKALSLFEQEAVRLEELGHHPQIPELLAYFQQDGNQYLVQEFIHGKNLADALAEQGAFVESQVREVLAKLLPVLDFVHTHHVIHRDIKPANIIITGSQLGMSLPRSGQLDGSLLQQALTIESSQGCRNFVSPSYRFNELLGFSLSQPPIDLPPALYTRCQQLAVQFFRYSALPPAQRQYLIADASHLLYEMQQVMPAQGLLTIGRLVLVDFGAAKSLRTLEPLQTGTTIGSPEYVAPEQARGKAMFASDLYSLGVTAVHLLTQVSPYDLFDPATDAWIWRKYLATPISDQLAYILDRLLERSLARRYPSAADVLQDLEGATIAPMTTTPPLSPLPLPVAAPVQAIGAQPLAIAQPASITSHQPSFRISRRPKGVAAPLQTQPPPAIVEPPVAIKSRRRSPPTWQCLQTIDSPARIHALALHPMLPLLASTSGSTIKLWDLATGQPIRTLTGHLDIIPTIAFSPDGKFLFSGSADKSIGIWDHHTGRRLSTLSLHADTVLAIAISGDGRWLASSSVFDPIILWDLVNGYQQQTLTGHTHRTPALAFSPLANCDRPHPDLPELSKHQQSPEIILASGSADLTVKLWNLETGNEQRTLDGHTQPISTLAFSPDGTLLASGSWDGMVKLWNLKTRRQRTLDVQAGRINSVAFSRDGKKLAIASDSLQLWTLSSSKKVILPGHTDSVSTVLFGQDDQTLISASSDRRIKIWRYE